MAIDCLTKKKKKKSPIKTKIKYYVIMLQTSIVNCLNIWLNCLWYMRGVRFTGWKKMWMVDKWIRNMNAMIWLAYMHVQFRLKIVGDIYTQQSYALGLSLTQGEKKHDPVYIINDSFYPYKLCHINHKKQACKLNIFLG